MALCISDHLPIHDKAVSGRENGVAADDGPSAGVHPVPGPPPVEAEGDHPGEGGLLGRGVAGGDVGHGAAVPQGRVLAADEAGIFSWM